MWWSWSQFNPYGEDNEAAAAADSSNASKVEKELVDAVNSVTETLVEENLEPFKDLTKSIHKKLWQFLPMSLLLKKATCVMLILNEGESGNV